MVLSKQSQPKPRTYVLVHGAWHGGWCWRPLSSLLEQAGHRVLVPTLTGLGDRRHLLRDGINLSTHVDDIANLMTFEDLSDVFLVAHSYGGYVASGVAERLADRIASIMFLDAFLPAHGEALIHKASVNTQAVIQAATASGAMEIASPSSSAFGIEEADRRWVEERLTPQPAGTFTETAVYSGGRDRIADKSYLRATRYVSATFDANLARARADGWRTYELDCHHDAMIVAPAACADALLEMVG